MGQVQVAILLDNFTYTYASCIYKFNMSKVQRREGVKKADIFMPLPWTR